ncbi:MAG: ubiquinol-cytochrome c reductase iron-sulfur subunit [Phormidesmis sp.]
MKRRELLNFVGLGLVATSLPVAIAACTPNEPEETANPEADTSSTDAPAAEVDDSIREDGFAALGTVSELKSAGFLAKKGFIAGPVIAIPDPANADSIVAFDSMCTHNGCSVEWAETEFACPCHGSKYDTSGAVTSGPATASLGTYEAKVEDDLVLIKAA